jgi:hypothetical protein
LTPAALYGWLASTLLISAAITLLPLPRRRLVGSLVGLAALFSGAPVLHSIVGTPSFTLSQLALLRFLDPDQPSPIGRLPAGLLVVVAVVFYPLSLGLGPFDPFDLGYRPLPLLVALAPFGIWLAWRRQEACLMLLGFDLLAYALGLFDNLWNACFDPLLVILVVCRLLSRGQRGTVSTLP